MTNYWNILLWTMEYIIMQLCVPGKSRFTRKRSDLRWCHSKMYYYYLVRISISQTSIRSWIRSDERLSAETFAIIRTFSSYISPFRLWPVIYTVIRISKIFCITAVGLPAVNLSWTSGKLYAFYFYMFNQFRENYTYNFGSSWCRPLTFLQ